MGAARESTHAKIGGRSSLLVLRDRYARKKTYDIQGCDKYPVCYIFIGEYGTLFLPSLAQCDLGDYASASGMKLSF